MIIGENVLKLTFEEINQLGFEELTDYCRSLMEAGCYSPSTRVELYRGDTLCLVAKRIDEAAKVKVDGIYFKKYRGTHSRRGTDSAARVVGCV